MKTLATISMLALALLAVGCDDKSGSAPAPASTTEAQAAIQDTDLATPADFDDEAEKQVTPANYKGELDALDKEIAAE